MKQLSILPQLSTQQLDKILHAELRKTPVDAENVKTILGILEAREAGQPQSLTPQILAAWNDFRSKDPALRKPAAKSWVFKITAMAAALCIVLLAVVPQYTNAESWWDWFTSWTDSIFAFGSGEETTTAPEYVFRTDHPGLQQVYDTVTSLGITDPIVPMWIPEEYELIVCEQDQSSKNLDVAAIFSDGTNRLVFRAFVLGADTGNQYHKDAEDLTAYESYGTTYYLAHNLDSWTVAWIKNDVECMMLADCPEDVLKKIIWSIHTMEEKQ